MINSTRQEALAEPSQQPFTLSHLFQSSNSVAHRVPSYVELQVRSDHDLTQFLDKDIFAVTAIARPGESLVIDLAGAGSLGLKAIGRLVAVAIDLKGAGGSVVLKGIKNDSMHPALRYRLSRFVHIIES